MGAPRSVAEADPGAILTKAFRRAGELLGMTQRDLAAIVGASEASVSRLGRQRTLVVASKEGELAALFLRLFRGLDALVGGRSEKARAWLDADNHHLGGTPRELVRSVEGLVRTVHYLDAMRGKN